MRIYALQGYVEYKVNKINNLLFNNQNKIIASIDACLKDSSSGDIKEKDNIIL